MKDILAFFLVVFTILFLLDGCEFKITIDSEPQNVKVEIADGT